MTPKDGPPASPGDVDADTDLTRAFQELAKGEKTASAMETQLTALERKIDDLLKTVASSDEPGSKADKTSTESASNIPPTRRSTSPASNSGTNPQKVKMEH